MEYDDSRGGVWYEAIVSFIETQEGYDARSRSADNTALLKVPDQHELSGRICASIHAWMLAMSLLFVLHMVGSFCLQLLNLQAASYIGRFDRM